MPKVISKKLLLDCVIDPCGHQFKCWTQTYDDGTWEIHFHAPCAEGKSIATALRDKLYPGKKLVQVD
jgi:hypothetical protein